MASVGSSRSSARWSRDEGSRDCELLLLPAREIAATAVLHLAEDWQELEDLLRHRTLLSRQVGVAGPEVLPVRTAGRRFPAHARSRTALRQFHPIGRHGAAGSRVAPRHRLEQRGLPDPDWAHGAGHPTAIGRHRKAVEDATATAPLPIRARSACNLSSTGFLTSGLPAPREAISAGLKLGQRGSRMSAKFSEVARSAPVRTGRLTRV